MRFPFKILGNERGFVLVVTLLMLLILVIIGVAALNTSNIDLNIAGNQRVHKQTFYHADAGTEIAARVIEENISCPEGFTATIDTTLDGNNDAVTLANITVTNMLFAQPASDDKLPSDTPFTEMPSTVNRELFLDGNSVILPNTNVRIGGITEVTEGSGLAMNAGYIGLGYSAAQGGTNILYEVNSQNLGAVNSESVVSIRWRHMIGLEGECNY